MVILLDSLYIFNVFIYLQVNICTVILISFIGFIFETKRNREYTFLSLSTLIRKTIDLSVLDQVPYENKTSGRVSKL